MEEYIEDLRGKIQRVVVRKDELEQLNQRIFIALLQSSVLKLEKKDEENWWIISEKGMKIEKWKEILISLGLEKKRG